MNQIEKHDHIVSSHDIAGGKPHINGHRITVENIVVWHLQMGISLEEICHEYDLGMADLHAALTYYYDHQAEIDERLKDGAAFAQALRENTSSKLPEKLKAARGD